MNTPCLPSTMRLGLAVAALFAACGEAQAPPAPEAPPAEPAPAEPAPAELAPAEPAPAELPAEELPAEEPPPVRSPWWGAKGPTPRGETILAWTGAAAHHGVSLPHGVDSLTVTDLPEAERDALFLANLRALRDELAHRPRVEAYLVDPDGGFYLPPEAATRPASGPEDVEALEADLDAAMRALLPPHPEYARLVEVARAYASVCEGGGWEALDLGSRVTPSFKEALAARLAREDFLDLQAWADSEPRLREAALREAVRSYRLARHLPALRRFIDADLVAALNVPCAERLEVIHLNLRRWRSSRLPADGPRVFVNLAAQELVFLVDDAVRIASRVVVGSSRSFYSERHGRRIFRNATPILEDSIARVVFNPTWNVPSRIIQEEIEPAVAKNPNYLKENHFKVINGRTYVQQPGDHNALGRVKILFPNDEGIYLHDTPHKGKFQLPVRAASHGCVRVERVQELALALLEHDRANSPGGARPAFSKYHLKRTLETLQTTAHPLEQPIPVVFEYYTVSVTPGDDGTAPNLSDVRFHPDIYAYDAAALRAN